MKVFVNCKWMAQRVTGTQRFASELTRRLDFAEGVSPILVLPSDGVLPDWGRAGFTVVRSRFKGIIFEQFALPLITRRGFLINLGGPAPIFKRNQVATMHDASFIRLPETYSRTFVIWYKVLYRSLSISAKHIATVSHFSARELGSFLKVPATSLVVISNGADHMVQIQETAPVMELPTGPFALCVGTLAKHKNLEPVIWALSQAGISVVVVGASGNQRVFSSEGSLWGQGIHVAGRITDGELKWLYKNATALVFPSLYEGFGLPVIEAQQCGCPVISSDRASLTEVGGDGGVYFDAKSPESAVEHFGRILNDFAFRGQLVDAGFENAKKYTWAASARVLSRLANSYSTR